MDVASPIAGLTARNLGWPVGDLPVCIGRTVLVTAIALGVLAAPLRAQLSVEIVDHRGRPAEQAVVLVFPATGPAEARSAGASHRGVMDQIDETFAPHVLVVTKGQAVEFPNHDDVRHHVYSFSDAKNFELPLYEGKPAHPVIFDEVGPVVLGCNIHDWMRGYIYVTAAPFTVLSVEGNATVTGLSPGEYRVEVWHPRLRSKENWAGTVTVAAGAEVTVAVEIRLKPAIKIRRAPKAGTKKY